jgi:hypothetical protein
MDLQQDVQKVWIHLDSISNIKLSPSMHKPLCVSDKPVTKLGNKFVAQHGQVTIKQQQAVKKE